MECNSLGMQNMNSVSFGSLKGVKVDKKLMDEYPSIVHNILDRFESNSAVKNFTEKYDCDVEIGRKKLLGGINKYIFKLRCLGKAGDDTNANVLDAIKDVFSNGKQYVIKHTSYQKGVEPKKLEKYLDKPEIKYTKYHEAREGVGKDDLGGHSAYWDTKEVGTTVKNSLQNLDCKISRKINSCIEKANKKKVAEQLRAQRIEAETQRIANIPNDQKQVEAQISRLID